MSRWVGLHPVTSVIHLANSSWVWQQASVLEVKSSVEVSSSPVALGYVQLTRKTNRYQFHYFR